MLHRYTRPSLHVVGDEESPNTPIDYFMEDGSG